MKVTDEAAAMEMFLDAARDGRIPTLVDKRTPSGNLVPVFGPPSRAEEEYYIQRMLQRDRETKFR